MTDPTGSRVGSAAAIPVRAATPEAVVVPLQYAVASNCSRAPGVGSLVPSISSACRAANRESETVASYSSTNAVTRKSVGSAVRQR